MHKFVFNVSIPVLHNQCSYCQELFRGKKVIKDKQVIDTGALYGYMHEGEEWKAACLCSFNGKGRCVCVFVFRGGGGGKALTITMTPWNLTHGQWSKNLTMATDSLESAPWSMVKVVIFWSNFMVKSKVYHFDHRKFE